MIWKHILYILFNSLDMQNDEAYNKRLYIREPRQAITYMCNGHITMEVKQQLDNAFVAIHARRAALLGRDLEIQRRIIVNGYCQAASNPHIQWMNIPESLLLPQN